MAAKCPESPAQVSTARALFAFFCSPYFRSAAWTATGSIFKNFFFLQYKAALLRRYPVSQVDHPLDEKIPFRPEKVEIYAEFLHFFVRALAFLHRRFGDRARGEVKSTLESIGVLYEKAAEVYIRNFSTTRRPRYLRRFKFLVIHAFDPHLMCIPSLHVMVVIRAYTCFRDILSMLGEKDGCAAQIEELRRGALAITEAVLYIKQHSINCISAAMYAMSRFDHNFPLEEAEAFAQDLFINADDISREDAETIRKHIIGLYRRFLDQESKTWETPLLDFLMKK